MLTRNQIECARVFVCGETDHEGKKNYIYTLKCEFCHSLFKQWSSFAFHIQARHQIDLVQDELNPDLEKQEVDETTEEINSNDGDGDNEIDVTELSLDRQELQPIIDFKVEIMPMNFKPEDDIKSNCSDASLLNENSYNQLEKYFASCLSNDEEGEEQNEEEETEELFQTYIGNDSFDDDRKLESTITTLPMRSRNQKRKLKELSSNESDADEYDETAITDLNVKNLEYEEENALNTIKKKRTAYSHKSPFFHMRLTEPKLMLSFIEIIRHHPCHWNPDHLDFNSRDARDESAELIADQLAQQHSIHITPQVARTSVLFLCRWYEREYIFSTASGSATKKYTYQCKKRPRKRHRCSHPEYFKALDEFLPSHHLKVTACDQCPRQFKSESHLLTHKHVAHGGDIPFRCNYCPRGFAHLSSLRYHENRHTKQRTWPCELCPYRGLTTTDYQHHMTTHTNARAFVCEVCGAAYKSSTSLSVHKRTHEPPRLSCKHCGKMFRENYRLKRHMWLHEAKDDSKKKVTQKQQLSHKCSTCKRHFSSVATLQKHRQQIHGIKSKKAAASSPLKVDHRTEENKEQDDECDYSCTACEVDFINLKELRAHSLKMHDIVII